VQAINETRSDVDETLSALLARLSPGQLLDRAMEVSAVGTQIGGAAESATDAVSNAAEQVSSELANARMALRAQSRRISEGFTDLLREQPLLVGAIGIALGALVGYALPATDAEDHLLGEASDATARRVDEDRVDEDTEAQLSALNETLSNQASPDNCRGRAAGGPGEVLCGDHEAQGLSDRT